jgi:hypothetical protein
MANDDRQRRQQQQQQTQKPHEKSPHQISRIFSFSKPHTKTGPAKKFTFFNLKAFSASKRANGAAMSVSFFSFACFGGTQLSLPPPLFGLVVLFAFFRTDRF